MSLKNPVFSSFISFLGVVCLAGAGLATWQVIRYNKLHDSVGKRESALKRLLGAEVSPTPQNRSAAAANYEAAVVREKELFDYIKGTKQFNPSTPGQFADLVANIRGIVNELTKKLEDSKVRIQLPNAGRTAENTFTFGFRRYIANTDGAPPQKMQDIAKQSEIVRFLVNSLANAKTNVGSAAPVILQSVMREPVELSLDKATGVGARSINTDEYNPRPEERISRPDLVKSYYFRVVFTGRTDVFRNYINSIYAAGYPIFLRGVTVSAAKPEVLSLDSSPAAAAAASPVVAAAGSPPPPPGSPPPPPALDFGFSAPPPLPDSAPAAPAAVTKQPNVLTVLDGTPAEFTLSFEYVEPQEIAQKTTTKGSSNS